MPTIDLNAKRQQRAARREAGNAPIPVLFADREYLLPVELPATVIDIALGPDSAIAAILISLAQDLGRGDREQATAIADRIAAVLTDNPSLPADIWAQIRDALAALFDAGGTNQWADFWAAGPSVADLVALIAGLFGEYGVSLGEAWRSRESSDSDGVNSSATSPAPVLTLDASGATPPILSSLVSGG